MVPRRVMLKGFLSYRDEVEIDFSGTGLWLLGGANGSGKSAVFDAVTFALFGVHRGGSTGHSELLHREADALAIEFDFLLESELYRIRRTLKKSKTGGSPASSQQVLHQSQGRWLPVPDTTKKPYLDAWVNEHVGLNYPTFTSSVLLLQGGAEKLLAAAPKARFEVLAQIVDLERFARLHEQADVERKELKGLAERLQSERDALPIVSEAEIEAFQVQIGETESLRLADVTSLDERRELEVHAKHWGELQKRMAEFHRRWEASLALIKESETIEKAALRLAELQLVVPQLSQALSLQSSLSDTNKTIAEADAKLATATTALTGIATELAAARGRLKQLDGEQSKTDELYQEAVSTARQLADAVTKVERYEELVREREGVVADLAKLGSDLATEVERLAAELAEIGVLATAMPHWERLAIDGERLTTVTKLAETHERQRATAEVEGKRLKEAVESLTARTTQLKAAVRAADEEAASARTLSKQADELFAAVTSMAGSAVCRACGQSLTPQHLEAERKTRSQDRTAAASRLEVALKSQRLAATELTALEKEQHAKSESLTKLRSEYSALVAQLKQHQGERERLTGEIAASRAALPTELPIERDLAADRARIRTQASVKQRESTARTDLATWTQLQHRETDLASRVEVLKADLPGNPEAIRREQVRLLADEGALRLKLDAVRKEAAGARNEIDAIAGRGTLAESDKARWTTVRAVAGGKLENDTHNLDAALAAIPEHWRITARAAKAGDLNAAKTELAKLQSAKTAERAAELAEAKSGLDLLKGRNEALQAEEAGVPADSRVSLSVAQMKVAESRKNLEVRELALADLRSQLANLETTRARGDQLAADLVKAKGDWNHADILAKLLGRDRLQRHLVRRAEVQIVDAANSALDSLSGGQLSLRLKRGDDDDVAEKALELEAFNRATGADALGVAFLSGSQRFRVAVSLALGIGQFASRRHRPIESVIIDEGFGCLDRNGRQTMIQELQNLRNHMKCILLVSHQEEFADAFPNGYHFELVDGSTQVTRMMR